MIINSFNKKPVSVALNNPRSR